MSSLGVHRKRPLLAVLAALALGGCASTAIDDNVRSVQALSQERLGAPLRWLTSDEARRQAQAEVDAALAKPVGADDAVRLALAHSPAVQAMLFEGAAASANATQSARLPNPVFTFERLLRNEAGGREVEINRMLGVSVFDLLLWPARTRLADAQQQQTRLRLASEVVQAATEARQNWVRAVAAQQSLQYFEQVKLAADASAELARRMQAVGNFSKLQRAREQAFSADAVAELARARMHAQRSREALVRSLGLNGAQAQALTLPDRLPDLPAAAKDEATVTQAALDQRLDVRLARVRLEFSAREQGLTRVSSIVKGLEIAAVRNTETGRSAQRGVELQLLLPIFDTGDAARAGAQASYMAAVNRTAQVGIDAASQLRESYAGYRTAYDLARHYRDEIVPLRKTISDENLLRYNGMLIGVFELLADAREQVASVVQAIDAQRDFWLADAALQAALIGVPRTQDMETQ
jgi:outer membrane protein TolC